MTKNNHIHLDDQKRRKRLRELTNLENPTSLLSEIAILRLLEEEMLNAGNTRAVVEVVKAIGTLSHNVEIQKLRKGELLAKSTVLALATKFASLLAEKISGRFDGWENVLEEIQQEGQALIIDARNIPIHEERL